MVAAAAPEQTAEEGVAPIQDGPVRVEQVAVGIEEETAADKTEQKK